MDGTCVTFLEPSTIIDYEKSTFLKFRIRLFFGNGKRMDIGCKEHTYYVVDNNKIRRDAYYDNLKMEELVKIYTRTPCRTLFEAIILNGKYPTILENINFYNSTI